MGNTCQLPVLTPEANLACADGQLWLRVVLCGHSCPVPLILNLYLEEQNQEQKQRTGVSAPQVLHNPTPLSTGCAQRGNDFELRAEGFGCRVLSTES